MDTSEAVLRLALGMRLQPEDCVPLLGGVGNQFARAQLIEALVERRALADRALEDALFDMLEMPIDWRTRGYAIRDLLHDNSRPGVAEWRWERLLQDLPRYEGPAVQVYAVWSPEDGKVRGPWYTDLMQVRGAWATDTRVGPWTGNFGLVTGSVPPEKVLHNLGKYVLVSHTWIDYTGYVPEGAIYRSSPHPG